VQLARELTLELEKYVTLPDLHLPRPSQTVDPATPQDEIEALADDVRQQWNIPKGPVDDVVRALERHGIVTTRFRVGLERVDAFCVCFPDRPVVVLGADKGLRDRSRFDAAHELGHLVMHHPDQIGDKAIEAQANQFAAAFLMPATDIRKELPSRIDWPTFIKLKAEWHVSIAALVVRAKTLRVMEDHVYTQAWKALSVRGWRKREPGDLGPPENPVLLRRAVDLVTDCGVSLDELVRRGGLPESDIKFILGDRGDERPRVEI
jgi:Zn-dependent peptidase ImmA (M78 family)